MSSREVMLKSTRKSKKFTFDRAFDVNSKQHEVYHADRVQLRMTELEFLMRISYLELYNEELCDLLSTDDHVKIRIYDDVNKKRSVVVQRLEEVLVNNSGMS